MKAKKLIEESLNEWIRDIEEYLIQVEDSIYQTLTSQGENMDKFDIRRFLEMNKGLLEDYEREGFDPSEAADVLVQGWYSEMLKESNVNEDEEKKAFNTGAFQRRKEMYNKVRKSAEWLKKQGIKPHQEILNKYGGKNDLSYLIVKAINELNLNE